MDAFPVAELHVAEHADHPGSDVSEAIRIARVVCIFFMVLVHVHPGTDGFTPDVVSVRPFDIARFFVVDSLGRASVALLSVVAGYLAVYSLRREDVRTFLGKKARSLVVPFFLWNLILIAMVVVAGQVHAEYLEQSFEDGLGLQRMPELLLGIGGSPANEPLAFLRDIFLCALLTPLFIASLRRSPRMLVAFTAVVALVVAVTPFGIRPSIIVLYAAGVFVATRGYVPVPSPRVAGVAVVAFLVLGALLTWRDLTTGEGNQSGLTWMEAGFNLIRVPAAVAFWSLAYSLRGSLAGKRLAGLEPYIFIAFCTHMIVSKIVWAVWEPSLGGYYGGLYPVFFFGMPALVIVCAVYGSRLLNAWVPWLFSLLNGGRNLPPRRQKVETNPAPLVLEPTQG